MNELNVRQIDMGGLAHGPQPVEVRLKERQMAIREQLADIERALASLEKQPELLETLNLLRRVGI